MVSSRWPADGRSSPSPLLRRTQSFPKEIIFLRCVGRNTPSQHQVLGVFHPPRGKRPSWLLTFPTMKPELNGSRDVLASCLGYLGPEIFSSVIAPKRPGTWPAKDCDQKLVFCVQDSKSPGGHCAHIRVAGNIAREVSTTKALGSDFQAPA